MQLEFLITLQNDRELIYQNDGTARRIVVRKLELWVPQLHFTGKGQTFVNENFLKPTQWKYLKENIFSLSERRDESGMFMIGSGIKKSKHVFVFFQQARKINRYEQNPYFFDTFDIDGDASAKLKTCSLQCGTNFYPQIEYDNEFKYKSQTLRSYTQLYTSIYEMPKKV